MTTCGMCVCPTPVPVPTSTDICQVINATHATCYMQYGLPSWWGAFVTGLFAGVIVLGFLYVVYVLFFKMPEKKP